jgi:hypothetical protein
VEAEAAAHGCCTAAARPHAPHATAHLSTRSMRLLKTKRLVLEGEGFTYTLYRINKRV